MDFAGALLATAAEAASNAVGAAFKLGIDTATTVEKIANGSGRVASKMAEDTASTVAKIGGDTVGTFAKVVSDSAGTADKVVNDAGDTAKQIFRGEIASIPGKLLHDGLDTGAKIVTDTARSLAKISTDTAGTASKVVSDLAGTASDVAYASLSTGDKIVKDTHSSVQKVGNDVLETTIHGASRVLSGRRVANALVEYATDIFDRAGDAQVVDAVLRLAQRFLEALGRSLGGAAVIWKGIFTNGTNEAHLRFILDHLYDLLRFLYDLVRPGTVISETGGTDGAAENGEDDFFPRSDNPYNELDLRLPENLYAINYQVQRVVKTLVKVLKMGRSPSPRGGLDGLEMDMSLGSDYDKDGKPMPATHLSKLKDNQPSRPDETWLFINGIANEYVWFQRTCDKIRDAFRREVKGVYNRTDGILWDLIECFGEHSSVRKNDLIERTQSSKAAQAALELELRNVLFDDGPAAPGKVVMIAHSQGCLVLRLALQTLVAETAKSARLRRLMKQRLRVFTFASPAIDWRVLDGDAGERSLSEYASLTEHYAHEMDFVAVLGIVTHRIHQDSGYDEDSVFLSKGGRGHLLGAHYPLRAGAYQNGDKSMLFRALNGDEMA